MLNIPLFYSTDFFNVVRVFSRKYGYLAVHVMFEITFMIKLGKVHDLQCWSIYRSLPEIMLIFPSHTKEDKFPLTPPAQ